MTEHAVTLVHARQTDNRAGTENAPGDPPGLEHLMWGGRVV